MGSGASKYAVEVDKVCAITARAEERRVRNLIARGSADAAETYKQLIEGMARHVDDAEFQDEACDLLISFSEETSHMEALVEAGVVKAVAAAMYNHSEKELRRKCMKCLLKICRGRKGISGSDVRRMLEGILEKLPSDTKKELLDMAEKEGNEEEAEVEQVERTDAEAEETVRSEGPWVPPSAVMEMAFQKASEEEMVAATKAAVRHLHSVTQLALNLRGGPSFPPRKANGIFVFAPEGFS